jgi:hypothetical protein
MIFQTKRKGASIIHLHNLYGIIRHILLTSNKQKIFTENKIKPDIGLCQIVLA